MEWQRERFRVHIRACEGNEACRSIIHTRSSSDDTVAAAEVRRAPSAASSDCFTETMDVACAALDPGFMISFSGILTFKNAADLREVAAFAPLDRRLIETDSPLPRPGAVPRQDQQPVLRALRGEADRRAEGVPVEAIAQATSENFERLFPVREAHLSACSMT